MAFGVLEFLSGQLVALIHTGEALGVGGVNPIKAVTKPVTELVSEALQFFALCVSGSGEDFLSEFYS